MEETQIHYYNVVTGGCPCGAVVNTEVKNFAVFPHLVNCPVCLTTIRPNDEKSESNSGGAVR